MSVVYTNTEPSKKYCSRYNCWCVMANEMGSCSSTACMYGYGRKTYTNTTQGITATPIYDYMTGKRREP